MLVNDRFFNFLLHINKKGFITRKTQSFYISRIGYYMTIWNLRDLGIIEESGNDNGEKKWILTGKGEEICEHLEKLKELGFV